MLIARKYTVCKEDSDLIIASYPEGRKKRLVYVYFVDCPSFTVKLAKYYYYLIEKNKIKHCIIIYRNSITPTAKNGLTSFYDIRIELFLVSELQFNITTHCLVPKHVKVSRDKTVDYSKFPGIKTGDPICRFYGYQVGDLIKIIRLDKSITFRIVR